MAQPLDEILRRLARAEAAIDRMQSVGTPVVFNEFTLANNAAQQIFASPIPAGLLVVSEFAVDGNIFIGWSNAAITGELADPGTMYSVTAGTASSVNIYVSGGLLTLENKRGGSRSFRCVLLRTR